MNDIVFLPAHQLAKGIRDRTFSAVEVLEAHLVQLNKHNSKLNAIVTLNVERARQQAQAADEMLSRGEILGALHGVPITIKDNIATAELRTTYSYKPLTNYVPGQKEADNSQLKNFAFESTQIQRPFGEYHFLWTDNFANLPLTTNTKEVLDNFILKLTILGCQVESFNSSKFDFGQVWQTYGEIASSELYKGKSQIGQFLYRMILSLLLSSVVPGGSLPRRVLHVAKYLSSQTNREILTQRQALIVTFEKILANYDAMLCPVCTREAFPHSWRGKPIEVDGQKLSYMMAGSAHSTVFNLTGSPVVVIPIGLTKDGLPVAIQIVGKRGQDMELLAVAEKLTEATEGFQKPPGY